MQSFAELNLSAPLARAISDLGYEKPSEIQAQTLPILLGEPTDFLGLAATGTGKTAAFSIPMLESIEPKKRSVQALILCPTRELALQVSGQVALLGKHKGVRPVAIYGGSSYGDQIRGLEQGASVVVGTPGRIMDHLERGTLKLGDLKMLVLDEADEMISMGFKDELEKILASVPRETSNIWLFSATMSREVRRVADEYLRSPKQVQVNRTEVVPSTIEQLYYAVHENDKPEVVCKLIEAAESFYGLIFCQTKSLVVDLTQYLHERGYKVDSLHGDKDQASRERTMSAFRERKVELLVCTDVASRGLDVKDITHVINYSLPRELDNYVHRIGRTARSGKTGVAMNLVTPSHRRLIWQIENMTKSKMSEGRIPTRREIGARKVAKQFATFEAQAFFTRAIEVMNEEFKARLMTMTPDEVAGRFLTMMMPEVFNDRDVKQKSSVAKPHPGRPKVSMATVLGEIHRNEERTVSKPTIQKPVAKPVEAALDESITETAVAGVTESAPEVASAEPNLGESVDAVTDAAAVEAAPSNHREDRRRQLLDGAPRAARRERGGGEDRGGERRPRFASRGGDRPSFGDGGERPRFARADRPSFGERSSRPSFGGGGFAGGDRPPRSSFGERNSRPGSGGSFGGERSSRPSFGGGGSRPFGGGDERPRSFDRKPRFEDADGRSPRGPRFNRENPAPRAAAPAPERPARRLPKEGEATMNRAARRALKFGTVSAAVPKE